MQNTTPEPKRIVLPPAGREEMYQRAGLKPPDKIMTRNGLRPLAKRRGRPTRTQQIAAQDRRNAQYIRDQRSKKQ